MIPRLTRRAGLLAACVVLAPMAAAAQDPVPAPPPPSPLLVQQVENGWLGAPDVKFARIDDRDAALVGGYAGWVTDRTFLVGGGAYWLANGHDGAEMAYGGLVLEYLARTDRRIGFGARALIGGGEATMPVPFASIYGPVTPVTGGHDIHFGGHHGGHPVRPPGWGSESPVPYQKVLWNDTYFIAEPQANVLLNLSGWCRLNVGVGYRLIGGASMIDDQLRGVSGTVAVQFGGGK